MSTTEQTTRNPREMTWDGPIRLDQVLAHTRPAYGGTTWAEALPAFANWPTEQAIVDTLAAELTTRLATDPAAVFDEPIRIVFDDPETWDADDVAEHGPCPDQPHIGNGMHRIAATAAAGGTHIWATTTPAVEPPTTEYVDVEFRIHDTGTLTREEGWDLADGLRSFRLNDQAWVEACGFGYSSGIWDATFHCPHRYHDALLAALTARVADRGGRFELVTTRCKTAAQWDASLDAWAAAWQAEQAAQATAQETSQATDA